MELENWTTGCDQYLQSIAREIESLSSQTRQIRTNAVKFDQFSNLQSSSAVKSDPKILLRSLHENINNLNSSNAWRNFCATESDQNSKACDGEFRALHLENIIISVRDFSDGMHTIVASQQEPMSPKIRRKPTLLQKGAKHFASLAGVFQLQDSFAQRVEHILGGIAHASRSSPDTQPLMMHIVNAQISGLAKMIKDFTDTTFEATALLKSLHKTAAEQALEGDLLNKEQAALLAKETIDPMTEIIARCRSFYLEMESKRVTDELVSEHDARRNHNLLTDDQAFEISSSLSAIEENIEMLRSQHPRLMDDEATSGMKSSIENYVTLEASTEKLGLLSDKVAAFVTEFEIPTTGSVECGAETDEFLQNMTNSFTMDVERSDHRAALHRLGLSHT